jgi:hypothetical protein
MARSARGCERVEGEILEHGSSNSNNIAYAMRGGERDDGEVLEFRGLRFVEEW